VQLLIVHLYLKLFLLKQDHGSTLTCMPIFMATYPLIRPLEIVLSPGSCCMRSSAGGSGFPTGWHGPSVCGEPAGGESSLSSRTAFWTGTFVLIFLVIHVNTFFVSSRFFPDGLSMHERVYEAFQSPLYVTFYLWRWRSWPTI